MKNNINNLISEELKKVTLLFKYDTQKTLSENIEEQQVGDKKFNFNPNPELTQDGNGINYTPTSPSDMFKKAQTTVSGNTQTTGTTSPSTTGSTVTSGNTSTSVLITKNPNDKAYDYMMKDGKYYFKGKTGTKYATKYPNWTEAKAQKGITAIKALFDKNPKGDTPVDSTTPTNNSEKYREKFAQMAKDAQNLPKTIFGTNSGESQKNDGIIDSDAAANNTQVQGQVQSNVSNDEEF